MMRRLVVLISVLVLSLSLSAQDYAEMIKADPAAGAANLMNYHFEKTEYTRPPKGYKPFYISHYGRHGSRYDARPDNMDAIWPVMRKADSLGILSDAGKAFYKDFDAVMKEQTGMVGMLTSLGAQEHRQIAERMAGNFPEVFRRKDGADIVYCQSTNIPRCLMSMTNFVHALDRKTGELEFVFVTGEKYYDVLAYHPKPRIAHSMATTKESDQRRAVMKPMDIVSHFFSDVQKASEIIGDPYLFEQHLYLASCVGHLTDYGVCLLAHFPHDILVRNWEMRNPRFYLAYGMSNEMSEYQKQVSRVLLADLLKRADDALENGNGVAADLRFGHDTGLLPLVGHIGIEGMDNWAAFHEVNSVWNSSVSICMASNLQMIFYRNKSDDILVKLLYNEKETTIPALKTLSGPYYRWSDLKAYLTGLL